MNLFRKILLRLANGVALEDMIHQQTTSIIKTEFPIVTLRIRKMIWTKYPEYSPIQDIVDYTMKEIAYSLADEMKEKGMIRYIHSHTHDEHVIEAEIKAVKWE